MVLHSNNHIYEVSFITEVLARMSIRLEVDSDILKVDGYGSIGAGGSG